MVTSALQQNPTSGDVHVFLNRRRDRMKLLLWDRTGFWLFYKRLEQGTFQLPTHLANQTSLALRYDELMMILEGIDLTSIIYTLVATAKLHRVEPFAYLKDILTRLPDYSHNKRADLLPQNWQPKS